MALLTRGDEVESKRKGYSIQGVSSVAMRHVNSSGNGLMSIGVYGCVFANHSVFRCYSGNLAWTDFSFSKRFLYPTPCVTTS